MLPTRSPAIRFANAGPSHRNSLLPALRIIADEVATVVAAHSNAARGRRDAASRGLRAYSFTAYSTATRPRQMRPDHNRFGNRCGRPGRGRQTRMSGGFGKPGGMPMQWIEAALDRLFLALNGSARDRQDNVEATAMAVALALAVIAFGFELSNPTLGIDDFAHLGMPFGWDPFYIGRGSWGTLLVQYLTPGGWITPFVSLVIGLVLQLLAAVLVGWALGVRGLPPLQQALLYALFVAFPYFACQMAFDYVQIAYPLASLLMVCGILLALAGDRLRGACAALAIGPPFPFIRAVSACSHPWRCSHRWLPAGRA